MVSLSLPYCVLVFVCERQGEERENFDCLVFVFCEPVWKTIDSDDLLLVIKV
jgi:hypothetical protein